MKKISYEFYCYAEAEADCPYYKKGYCQMGCNPAGKCDDYDFFKSAFEDDIEKYEAEAKAEAEAEEYGQCY